MLFDAATYYIKLTQVRQEHQLICVMSGIFDKDR